MALQAVLVVLISGVSLSASQSCGSLSCSQDYDASCPPDHSSSLYDNTMVTKSSCSDPIGPTQSLTADCFDTCITGSPIDPSIPLQCCADSVVVPQILSVDTQPEYLIAQLYSPNEPQADYHLNTFCKYNVQCPSENFNLYYTLVQFDVEPPDANDQCLDFMRYQFTATGAPVDKDVCGNMVDLPDVLKSGVHGSGLTLDFRSNRINTRNGFFLALTCTLPSAAEQASSQSSPTKKRDIPSSTDGIGVQQNCTPSQTLRATVGRDSTMPQKTSEEYFDQIFPTEESNPFEIRFATTVSRGGVVKYEKGVIFVEHNGTIVNRFTKIRTLDVYNKIEGYLTFFGGSTPPGRTFPGYGFLQVGKEGIVQYIQTIIDPKFLLNDEEELIVHDMFEELFIREKLADQTLPSNATVNCDINRLAELNIDSCSDAVRAVANFFLKSDTFQNFCDDC